MIRRIKQNTPQIENTIAKAVDFEIQIADIVERDQRRSWLVAFMSMFLVLIMATSYVLIFPLRKVENFMVITDPYMNVSRVVRLEDDKAFLQVVSQDALLKRSATDYVKARENFDFPGTAYYDYPKVASMSSSEAIAAYNELYSPDNRKNPAKEMGSERAYRINITNTELRRIGDRKDMNTEAIIRFQRFQYVKNGGVTTYKDSKIATMRFTFDRSLLSDPGQQRINPLGMWVTSYRVDNDNSAPPPPPAYVPASAGQKPATAAPAAQAPLGAQVGSAAAAGQGQQIPRFGAPSTAPAPGVQPQLQNPAQPAVQPQSAPPAGQAPNQVNGVRN